MWLTEALALFKNNWMNKVPSMLWGFDFRLKLIIVTDPATQKIVAHLKSGLKDLKSYLDTFNKIESK